MLPQQISSEWLWSIASIASLCDRSLLHTTVHQSTAGFASQRSHWATQSLRASSCACDFQGTSSGIFIATSSFPYMFPYMFPYIYICFHIPQVSFSGFPAVSGGTGILSWWTRPLHCCNCCLRLRVEAELKQKMIKMEAACCLRWVTIAHVANFARLRPTWFLPVVPQGNLPWRNLLVSLQFLPPSSTIFHHLPPMSLTSRRAMVASPWWQGRNSPGPQGSISRISDWFLASSSDQNSQRRGSVLPTCHCQQTKSLVNSWKSLVSKAFVGLNMSKLCLGMQLQAKSGSRVGC